MFDALETTNKWHLCKIKFRKVLNPEIDMAVIRSSGGDEWRTGIREKYRIRDPAHGLIRFGGSNSDRDRTDLIAWKLLNAAEFQRLRRIRQLGFSELVFPGATHSRFAHSIGIYHMVRRLADIIASRKGHEHDADRERVRCWLLCCTMLDTGRSATCSNRLARQLGIDGDTRNGAQRLFADELKSIACWWKQARSCRSRLVHC